MLHIVFSQLFQICMWTRCESHIIFVLLMAAVNKLAELQHLKKLTLHANPIEEVKNYRLHVFTQIPQLRMLDFINMTKVGRDKAQTWNSLKFKPKF